MLSGLLFERDYLNRKRRQPASRIAQSDPGKGWTLGKHMFRQAHIDFKSAKHRCGGNAGNQNGREQGRKDDVQQVVSSVQSRDADQ